MSLNTSTPTSASRPSDSSDFTPPGRKDQPVLILCAVLLIVGLLLVVGLGQTPEVENRERRIFNVIADMTSSGDYLVPRIKGKPHLTKPPLYYWLGSGVELASRLPERIAGRIPSALAALALIALVFWFCRAAGWAALALPAALLMTACYEIYPNARCANFDMLLSLFTFAATACFYLYMKRERFVWLLLAGVAFALALLTKATPAIPLVLIPLVLMLKCEGRLKLLRQPALLAVGILIPLALAAAWFLLLMKLVPQAREVFRNQGLLPFGVKSEHTTALHFKNPLYFFYKLFKITTPAVLLLPLLARRMVSTRGYLAEQRGLRWMLYSFLGIFLIFTIIPQKQEAYLLPTVPFLAIFFSDALVNAASDKFRRRALQVAGYLAAAAVLGAIPLTFFYFFVILGKPAPAVFFSLVCLALGAALILFARRQAPRPLLAAGLAGWWLFLAVFYGSYGVWDSQFKTGEIYQKPYYSKSHWDGLFLKYPVLKNVFKTSERFIIDKNDPGN